MLGWGAEGEDKQTKNKLYYFRLSVCLFYLFVFYTPLKGVCIANKQI